MNAPQANKSASVCVKGEFAHKFSFSFMPVDQLVNSTEMDIFGKLFKRKHQQNISGLNSIRAVQTMSLLFRLIHCSMSIHLFAYRQLKFIL